jgi:hypothetical protein
MNGSITRSFATTAPIDAYEDERPFRNRHQVGPDVVALGSEPRADAPEAGDHLVGAEQDVVAVAELAHAAPVALRRQNAPPAFCTGSMITMQIVSGPAASIVCSRSSRQEGGELGLRLAGRAVVAVRVADVQHLGHERLERRASAGMPLIDSAPIVVPW